MRFILVALTMVLAVSRVEAQNQCCSPSTKSDPHPDSASRNNPAWDSAYVRQFEAKRRARAAERTPAQKAEHDSAMVALRKKMDEMRAIAEKHRKDAVTKQQADTVSH